MGRITPSFRIMFQEQMEGLKKTYCQALIDPKHREAFGALGKAWTQEVGAMSYVRIPSVLDTMILTAIVDNRKVVEDLNQKLRSLKESIEEIRETARELSIPVQENVGRHSATETDGKGGTEHSTSYLKLREIVDRLERLEL